MTSWTRTLFGIAACLAMGACDSGVGPSTGLADAAILADAGDDYVAPIICQSVAGTRLKREYLEPEAMARQEFRVIDAVHDVECRYRREADGSSTCYPINNKTTSAVYFQDAACTSALARFLPGAEPRQFTRYARSSAVACAPEILEYRVIGAASPVAGGAGLFERDGLGACVAAVGPAGDYYVAGPPLLAANFVSATTEPYSTDTRISQIVQVGSDGSRMCDTPLPKLDSALGVGCDFRLGANGDTYCMPVGGISSTFFADEVCESVTEVVSVSACESVVPSFVATDTIETCGAVTRSLSEVLAQEVTVRYQSVGAECELINPDTNTYYQVGAPAADSSFVAMSNETEILEGRLKRVLLTAADRFGEFRGLWYDTKLESNCAFGISSDGSLRCLPFAITTTPNLFTDPLCTSSIVTVAVQGECAPGGQYIVRGAAQGVRIFSTKLYETPVYALSGMGCQLVTDPVHEEDFELSPSSFQPGEIVRQ